MIQRTIIDTLHKEGKSQRVITERSGCSRSAVSKHIKCKLSVRKKLGWKMCTSNRDDHKLENTVKQSRFKCLGELHMEWTGAGVSASRVTTLRHLQGKGYKATSETETSSEASYLGEKKWRGTESMLLEVQCEVSTVSDDLGCHVICWFWFTVFSVVHNQRSHLPGYFRALHASFCWQALWSCWFHFPAGPAKGTKSWSNDHGVTVLDWPANSPDLNPIKQCFPNLSWRPPCPAYFACLSYLTHLILLISSLVETARTKLGVSD